MKKPTRFMVVDDDPINNALCEYTLNKCFENAEVKMFTKPEIALRAIKDEYGKAATDIPTVLFLDINMPTLTGWDFMDNFNGFNDKIQKQFTIFILSSSVNPSDMEKAASNPFISQFISKPLTMQALSEIFVGI